VRSSVTSTPQQVEEVLFRPLVRRTAAAAAVASVLLAVSGPAFLYAGTRRAAAASGHAAAVRMAALVGNEVLELPHLWYFATPKLARHLQEVEASSRVARIAIIDADGRRVDVPAVEEDGGPHLWWADAPVYRGSVEVARVWVGVDASAPLAQVLWLAIVSLLLSAILSTLLYALPVRLVDRAQHRIQTLLEKLESARAELAGLNSDLEARVRKRSSQLAFAAEALRKSEAALRKMAARAAEATEQERKRAARELHDGAGQVLTAIRLSLQVVENALEPDSPARERLAETEGLVDDAIVEVRRIAMALRPAALDRLGLRESLEELTRSIAVRADLEVVFEASDDIEGLPAAVESAAYRLVQECLTNVVRYSGASEATVTVSRGAGCLDVSVSDDGTGFDTEAPREGLGLEGMTERVALLGGRLSIESAPRRGTRVTASLPVVTDDVLAKEATDKVDGGDP